MMTPLIGQTALEIIATKRTGGEHNFKGIGYQLIYACYRLLETFSNSNDDKQVRLEGLEDVDVNSTVDDGSKLIQLKHSNKPFDADKFWKTGAIQNFLEIYRTGDSSRFLVVHNANLKNGELSQLAKGNLSEQSVSYWNAKIKAIPKIEDVVDTVEFLSRISFRQWSYQELQEECVRLLISSYDVNGGAEIPYLKALFYYAFEWSKYRIVVTKQLMLNTMSEIEDSFSQAPKNPAIEHAWIKTVSFDQFPQNANSDDYFDGRAARPADIAAGLPVQRFRWENKISGELKLADTVVIQASSGQGKSTLAWRIAMTLSSEGYSVYQLNSCQNWNEANAISEFVKTRLRIGQVPLLVVDNLSKRLSNWGQLLEEVADLPVKILVTTRAEDWFRYNSDESRGRVSIISLDLNKEEAKLIYNELKKRNKIAAGIDGWQYAFEQTAEKGLLIEYTYLLTKGEQLATRLKQQIKNLSGESDAAAKLEILRLISLADCMNVKLETDKLLSHVQNAVGIHGDRGIIIAQLENEYHLKLDKRLVEGLHPVRSRHLVDLLHQSIPLDSSLVSVFTILGENYVYDYAMKLTSFTQEERKMSILEKLSKVLATRPINEIVFFLDGLMHAEPQQYWSHNRKVYDEAYKHGGLSLFILCTVPFTSIDTLGNFAQTIGTERNAGLVKLVELKKLLTPYSFRGADVSHFTKLLARELNARNLNLKELKGLESLMRWFIKLEIPFPFQIDTSEQSLWDALNAASHNEIKELFAYFKLKEPIRYRQFTQTHKEAILGWLKTQSSSLTIEERGTEVHIEYILNDDEVDKANGYSVSRIELVHHFLPDYERYCTDIIIFPFPYEELYEAVRMNAQKNMTSTAFYHPFDVHLNQIWVRTIEANYSHSSAYHWQVEHMQRRKETLEFCQQCIKLFEGLIEVNEKKYQMAVKETNNYGRCFQDLQVLAKFKSRSLKHFEKPKFTESLRVIDRWFSAVSTFIQQYTGIVLTQENYSTSEAVRLPIINLKKVVHTLQAMQQAYVEINNAGLSFVNNDYIEDEQKAYPRLLRSILYYVSVRSNKKQPTVQVAKFAITEWYQYQVDEKLGQVHQLLDDFQEQYGYGVIKPIFFKKEALYDIATIGIENFEVTDQDAFWNLSLGLSGFAKADFAFVEVVFIKHGIATGALRFGEDYFRRIYNVNIGLESNSSDLPHPLPQQVSTELLAPLQGVKLPEKKSLPKVEAFVTLMMALWRLTEYRQRLSRYKQFENIWLAIKEEEELKIVNETILNLDAKDYCEYNEFIDTVKDGRQFPDKLEFVKLVTNFLRDKARDSQKERIETCNLDK